MMAYKLSSEAANDIEQIWIYTVATWSGDQADRYINLIFDEIEYLTQYPLSGREVSFISKGYRSSKVKTHIIFYRLSSDEKDIEIIRILHQQMDIANKLND